MTKKLSPILAIDTSCDETSTAVTVGTTVLANIIASQTQLHAPYGGVYPTIAKQAHQENIDQTIQVALKRAQLSWSAIQAIAVTQGPGLAPALEVGIARAKQLTTQYQKPLIAVNHLEGHLVSIFAQPRPQNWRQLSAQQRLDRENHYLATFSFPALGLIVSGGHTEFILINQLGQYQVLGQTIDDAAGECLDKVGRMLNLGYPAGPVIEQFAKKGDATAFEFPLPMTTSDDFNLSFSGLKTYARNLITKLETANQLDQQAVYNFAASFQKAVFRHICYKLNKILKEQKWQTNSPKQPKTLAKPSQNNQQLWLGGGVAANLKLRQMLRATLKPYKLKLQTPYNKKLCMDNAAMIGIAAGFTLQRGKVVKAIEKLQRRPRYNL
ncbi:MAG: tRNA (adenosine(37)-N6)-threonylcarbamoyltransferase complex transferase subunit TsaD [Candidatus Pacebacteria bacterium]|nr:tRNA (adenosine(37)-N6)-threonylcarbamoyltransferase complex transferase subunit TsaD [Candidatus Paceibacterota bacterium]